MKEDVKLISRKILSIALAILIVASVLPMSLHTVAYADGETVASYIVTVLDKDNNEIADAKVELNGTTEHTNDAGQAEFSDVPVGEPQITVEKDGFYNESFTTVINVDSTGFTINLKKLVIVSGTISGVLDDDMDSLSVSAVWNTDEPDVIINNNTYSFYGAEGQTYTVSAAANNYNGTTKDIVAGDDSADTAIEMSIITQTIDVTITKNGKVTINDNNDITELTSNNSVTVNINDGTVDINVKADANYHIDNVSGIIEYSNSGTTNAEINSDKEQDFSYKIDTTKTKTTLSVVFEIDKYNLETETLTNGEVSLDKIEANYGETVIITVVPNENYELSSIVITNLNDSNKKEEFLNDSLSSAINQNDELYENGRPSYSLSYTVKYPINVSATFDEIENIALTDSGLVIEANYKLKKGNTYLYNDNDTIKIVSTNSDYSGFVTVSNILKQGWGGSYNKTFGKKNEKTLSLNKSNVEGYTTFELNTTTLYKSKNTSKQIQAGSIDRIGTFIFDGEKPNVNNLKYSIPSTSIESDSPIWSNSAINVSANITDENGIKLVAVSDSDGLTNYADICEAISNANLETPDNTKAMASEVALDQNNNCSITYNTVQNQKYYLYAVDNAENVTIKEFTIKIDKTQPQVNGIDFVLPDGSDKIINFLTFGTIDYVYANGNVDVIVKVSDVGDIKSGISNIKLFDDDDEIPIGSRSSISGPDANGEYTCKFSLKLGENAKDYSDIKAQAIDGAGNASIMTDKNTAAGNSNRYFALISDIKPTASIEINTVEDYMQNIDEDDNLWFNNLDNRNIEFTVSLNDNSSDFDLGLKSAVVKINGEDVESRDYTTRNSITTSATINHTIDSDYIEKKLKNGLNGITVVVTNNNGETNTVTREIFIDKTAPIINAKDSDGVEIELVDNTAIDKVLNFLSFGNFANDKIKISITGYDNGDGSGINSIKLYNKTVSADGNDVFNEIAVTFKGEVQHRFSGLNARCDVFEIALNQIGGTVFVGNLYAQVIDNAGNSSDIVPIKDISVNDSVESNYFILEDNIPVITSKELDNLESDYNLNKNCSDTQYNSLTANYDVDENGDKIIQKWYGEDKVFNIVFTDTDENNPSGINNISASVNGQEQINKSVDAKSYNSIFRVDADQTVQTEGVDVPADGKYTIIANMQDNAGNKAQEYTRIIYIDRDDPRIEKFEFSTADYQDGKNNGIVETDVYGYYFNVETNVTITAVDEAPSSGIKSIEYKLVGFDENADDIEATSVDVSADNTIVVVVPEGFKGTIIAKATDNVGHVTDKYVTPEGVIFEKDNPTITFDVLKDIKGNVSKANDVKGDKEIFNNTVNVGVSVSDSFDNSSGIRKIEWTVEAPYDTDKNTTGTVEIPNVVPETDKEIDGWTITSEPDKNLIHELHGIIPVENESNDIVVTVTVTDRSGNVSTETISFSIDRIAPVVTLTYEDNNKATGSKDNYYKGSRVAIITVKERNFDPANIEVELLNGDSDYPYSIPDISKIITDINNWEPKKIGYNKDNPDETTYVFKFIYSDDLNGIMNFSMGMTDLAGNALSKPCTDSFFMDNTVPGISVVYSCPVDVQNGYYYAAKRTATVTIVDHNFDNSSKTLFVNKTTQKNNGDSTKTVSQPQFKTYEGGTVAYKIAKDTYQTVIEFDENAEYTFAFSVEDNAGNIYEYEPELFDIDKDLPILKITDSKKSGVDYQKDYAAYNDRSENSIIPVISIIDEDGNIDPASIEVILNGYKVEHEEKKYNAYSTNTKSVTNGYEITINDFNPKSVDIDDIYALSIVAKDLAGNVLRYDNHISVNRYGSNYTYDFANQAEKSAYFNNTLYTKAFVDPENPITLFTEINCDFLDIDSTVLSLVYSNVKQQKQTEIELVRGKDYNVVEPDSKEEFSIKQYGYQLINAELFNEDGVYELFATTHDAATNTNLNSEAVEEQETTRMILKFVVDNNAPRINIENSLESFKYKDDTHSEIVDNSSKIVDEAFSTDGKQATISINIDELNLGLDAIDVNTVNVVYNGNTINVDEVVESNGVYKVTFTLAAPEDLIITGKPLVIKIKDRAGNEGILKINDLLVSNNWFIRFINNPYAFYPTIAGLVLTVGGVAFFIIMKKRKESDDEE